MPVYSKLHDYRDGELFWQEKLIDWFRVAGVLAEHGLHASLRVGNTVVAARHLPNEVKMRTDDKGLVRVGVQDKEKELAARTARLVRAELNRLGMEIRQVVRRSARGRLGEEHDMVIEVVSTEDEGSMKKISGELKLRRLWSKAGLDKARLCIQKEAATECEWWQHEVSTGKWAGRLLVLARWSSLAAEGDPEIRVDYVPRDSAPRGFSGWLGSRRTFRALPQPVRPPPQQMAPPQAKAKAAPAANPKAQARAKARPFPVLSYRRNDSTNNLRVAPVTAIYKDLDKAQGNIGRDMEAWKLKFPTYRDSILTAPRAGAGRKRGGKEEWYATEPALFFMHSKRLKCR